MIAREGGATDGDVRISRVFLVMETGPRVRDVIKKNLVTTE